MKEYPGMLKLYYQNNWGGKRDELQRKLAELRDGCSSITGSFKIGEYPFFIVYCDELIGLMGSIHRLSRKIDGLCALLPREAQKQFFRQSVVEEIQQSNETENVRSTRKEIGNSMESIDKGEVGGRFEGMIRKYILLGQETCIPLNYCRDVRALFDGFIRDEIEREDPTNLPDGEYFRQKPVWVRDSRDQEIHAGFFPESAINEGMEQALSFLNNEDYDPLIRTAGFHFMFACVHPFYDGNGRMSRFISSARLIEGGVPRLAALRLSYVIKNRRREYYRLFKETEDRRNFGDMTCFVMGFLQFVREACEQAAEYLSKTAEQWAHYCGIIESMNLNDMSRNVLNVLVQVSLCGGNSLNMTRLTQETGISRYNLMKLMPDIEEYCDTQTKGRSTCYCANLNAIDDAYSRLNRTPKGSGEKL